MPKIQIKILSLRPPARYAIRRRVVSACRELQGQVPGLRVELLECGDPSEIGRYASVLILPSLVINEKTVCSGRLPARDEILSWLREAAGEVG